MSGFLRRLFSAGGFEPAALVGERQVGKNSVLAAGYGKMKKFTLEGKVLKVGEGPDEILAAGGCVKEAVSAEALKEAWERDMKIAFPQGADYNVEYHCTVTPVEGDPNVMRDDGDGVDDDAYAAVAAVAATTLFRA